MVLLVLNLIIELGNTAKMVFAEKPPSNRARMADGGVGHKV